ncbi:MAG: ribosomal L7Ae/L30e/S12e/Gadd45 family protein [Candidatus Caldatribacteriaceae bacterium]
MGLEELRLVKKVVGARATERALRRQEAKKVLIAQDVEKRIQERIEVLAKERGIEVEYTPSAKDLGRACGIDVAASCVALLKSERESVEK